MENSIEGNSGWEEEGEPDAQIIALNIGLFREKIMPAVTGGGASGIVEVGGKEFPVYELHCHLDVENGKINSIGKPEKEDPLAQKDLIVLKFAGSLDGHYTSFILRFLNKDKLSARAIRNIEQSIDEYNKILKAEK